jgi:regulator of sigma E protease
MLDFLWNASSFVVALGLLVTVHEYGHYWVARRNGVKVLRFSIGFGKALYKWHNKHGTEFVIALIPLGGYVKMLDERVEDVPSELKNQSFNNKTVLQRMAIIFAGPAANFIFAVVVLWLMFMIGEKAAKPVIGSVDAGSIVEVSGIKAGSQIVNVNGTETLDWNAVNLALVPSIGNKIIDIETVSLDTNIRKSYVLDIEGKQLDQQQQPIFKTLGINRYRPAITTKIAAITAGSAAEFSGLKVGDEVVNIAGEVIDSWEKMVEMIQNNANNPLPFEVMRGDQQVTVTITPAGKKTDKGTLEGFVGVRPYGGIWPQEYIITIEYGVLDAFYQGIEKTGQLIKLSFVMIGKLITADVSVKNLSGPISIAQGAGNSADAGFVKFLWFLALISVNLGVINLLPLPILDGGHLFYYTIELIRGRSVSERAQEIGFKFGAIVLFLLMGIALINDISRLS